MALIRYRMTVDGTDPLQVSVRGISEDLVPTYLTCFRFTFDEDMDVGLSAKAAAESVWKDGSDLDSALFDLTVDLYSFLAGVSERLCDGQCDHITRSFESTGYGVTVQSLFRWPMKVTDKKEDCEEGPDDPIESPEWSITISGQQHRKINLKPYLSAINTSGLSHPDLDPALKTAWQGVITSALSTPQLIGDELSPDEEYQYDTTGLSLAVNLSTKTVTLTVQASGHEFITTIVYSGVSGSFDSFGSVTLSGVSSESTNGPLGEFEDYDDFATTIGPSSGSVANLHGVATAEIEIALSPSALSPDDPKDKWTRLTPSISSSDLTADGFPSNTAVIDVSGSIVEKQEYDPTLLDPGFRTTCRYDFTHVNRRPFPPLCETHSMELHVAAESGYKHPIGRHPRCRYELKPKKS